MNAMNLTENLTSFAGLNQQNNATGLPEICHQIVSKRTFIEGYNDGFQAALGRFNLMITILFTAWIIYFVMDMMQKRGKLTNQQIDIWRRAERMLFALILALVTYMFVSIFIQPYMPA